MERLTLSLRFAGIRLQTCAPLYTWDLHQACFTWMYICPLVKRALKNKLNFEAKLNLGVNSLDVKSLLNVTEWICFLHFGVTMLQMSKKLSANYTFWGLFDISSNLTRAHTESHVLACISCQMSGTASYVFQPRD